MILLDYSGIAVATITSEIRGQKNVELDPGLIRHMVINSIRSVNKKFRGQYGEMVICTDNRNYWRKSVFPYYKANRKEAREKSGIDWNFLFTVLREIRNELKVYFPYKVIEVAGAEADDIIAALATYAATNPISDNGIVEKFEPVLIVSGDHDFIQLQKFENVKQYHPVKDGWIAPEANIDYYKFVHAVKGDSGDGIPNIFSPDNALVDKIRQKGVKEVDLKKWFEDRSTFVLDEEAQKKYERNIKLTDLEHTPENIKQEIVNSYINQQKRDRSHLMEYFSQYKMRNLLSHIGDF